MNIVQTKSTDSTDTYCISSLVLYDAPSHDKQSFVAILVGPSYGVPHTDLVFPAYCYCTQKYTEHIIQLLLHCNCMT